MLDQVTMGVARFTPGPRLTGEGGVEEPFFELLFPDLRVMHFD